MKDRDLLKNIMLKNMIIFAKIRIKDIRIRLYT